MRDRLLVQRLAREAKDGLVWIPDIATQNSSKAKVLAVGEKVRDVKPGDVVLVPGAGNKYPDWEQLDYIMIQLADIGGVFG